MRTGVSGRDSSIFAMNAFKPQMAMSNWLTFAVILGLGALLALAFIFVLLFVRV